MPAHAKAGKTDLLDLPIELLHAIVEIFALQTPAADACYFDNCYFGTTEQICASRSTLAALSRTCKTLNTLAIPVLYRHLLQIPDAVVDGIVSQNAPLLSHTLYLRTTQYSLDTLRHSTSLLGLYLGVDDFITHEAEELQNAFPHLSQLRLLSLHGSMTKVNINTAVLQSLHLIPRLSALSFWGIDHKRSFTSYPFIKVVRQLRLEECGDEIVAGVLSALAPYNLEVLELIDVSPESVETQLPSGEENWTKLSQVWLGCHTSGIGGTFVGCFGYLQQVEIQAWWHSGEDMLLFLRSLSATVRKLTITSVPFDLLQSLHKWLQQLPKSCAGMSILVSMEPGELISWTSDVLEVWRDAIDYASACLKVSEAQGILLQPHDLPEKIVRMETDFNRRTVPRPPA